MSTYASSECRRVSPSVHGNKFDTAHRKKAVANIFESVNQDALMRLFQKTGDMKAEERVRSIFSYTQDPEETARALMALKQRKKDKFLQIAGAARWSPGTARQVRGACAAVQQPPGEHRAAAAAAAASRTEVTAESPARRGWSETTSLGI
uniref:Transcriptional and immune response regulator a n=1 Tax=Scophthalmus maximus TaxID=52904 RepID=A0A8D3B5V3_SCOMX